MKKIFIALAIVLIATFLSTQIIDTLLSFAAQEDISLSLAVQNTFQNLSEALPNEDILKFFGASLGAVFLGILSFGVAFAEWELSR